MGLGCLQMLVMQNLKPQFLWWADLSWHPTIGRTEDDALIWPRIVDWQPSSLASRKGAH